MIIPNLRFKDYLVVFYLGQVKVFSLVVNAMTGDVAASNAEKLAPQSIDYDRLSIRPQ